MEREGRECTRHPRTRSTGLPTGSWIATAQSSFLVNHVAENMKPERPESGRTDSSSSLPAATSRVSTWGRAWRQTGRLVLLLDFDGTLAPIVDRPELAAMPPETRHALEDILTRSGVQAAIVSGRGMEDARRLARLDGMIFAGNHGMEIGGPGVQEIHAEAASARPALDEVIQAASPRLDELSGAWIEDKGLTLSIHYRQVERSEVQRVKEIVASTVQAHSNLRITEGKEVLEVRPRVDWDKGKAVEFLLDFFGPPNGTPAIYVGDDRTDEDAFIALSRWSGGLGEGVLVGDRTPGGTAAKSRVDGPREVAGLLWTLANEEPEQPPSA